MYKLFEKIFVMGFAMCLVKPALAQDDEPVIDDNTRDCIHLRSIRRTDIVDDRNILFHMRGKVVYHNILPRQCNGLAREDRFSYRTSAGMVCRRDMIRVLYHDPSGMREGNACPLGLFHKITREDAQALKEDINRPPVGTALPMPEPEEVGVEKPETENPESR